MGVSRRVGKLCRRGGSGTPGKAVPAKPDKEKEPAKALFRNIFSLPIGLADLVLRTLGLFVTGVNMAAPELIEKTKKSRALMGAASSTGRKSARRP